LFPKPGNAAYAAPPIVIANAATLVNNNLFMLNPPCNFKMTLGSRRASGCFTESKGTGQLCMKPVSRQ
jgi:hypothetical protein